MQISPFQGTISQMLGGQSPRPNSDAHFSLYNQNTWNQDQFQSPQPSTGPTVAAIPLRSGPGYSQSYPAVGQVPLGQGQLLAPGQLFSTAALAVSPRVQLQSPSQFSAVGKLASLRPQPRPEHLSGLPPLEIVPIPRPRPASIEALASHQLDYGDPNEVIDTGLKDVQGRSIKLSREAARGLFQVMAIAKTRGIEVKVNSAHRTIEHQEDLWEDALKKYGSASKARKWVAPPGKSRHNYGKAIDLSLYKGKNKISQREFDEIIAKAGMYRPMSWEGWHIEPLSTKKERSG